jgi:hypothetical protein
MEAFDRADASRRGGAQIAKISIPVKWQAPPEGFLKINWDASLDVSRKRMGMGIAIRDYRGKLLVAYCATREFITDPATAEALTAWQAAQLSHRLGLQNIVRTGGGCLGGGECSQDRRNMAGEVWAYFTGCKTHVKPMQGVAS